MPGREKSLRTRNLRLWPLILLAIVAATWLTGKTVSQQEWAFSVDTLRQHIEVREFSGPAPAVTADTAEIMAVLVTHPWICVDPAADGRCSRIVRLTPTASGTLDADIWAVLVEEGSQAAVESTMELQVTRAGFCWSPGDPFDNAEVAGPDETEDQVATALELWGDAFTAATDRLCVEFDPPRYDEASGTYTSSQHDSIGAAHYAPPRPVRFLAARPQLRPTAF